MSSGSSAGRGGIEDPACAREDDAEGVMTFEA
jgi:hypothetical protein